MNKTLSILCVSIGATLLAACATDIQLSSAGASAASSGTMYCHKESLVKNADGSYSCNWAASLREVCQGVVTSSRIAAGAVSGEPTGGKRCESGQWTVQVSMR